MTYSSGQASRADPSRRARGPAGSGTPGGTPWQKGEAPSFPGAMRPFCGRRRRSKAGRFSTERQASEGRFGRPEYVTVITALSTKAFESRAVNPN